jgi:hypothetical protein
MASRKIFNFASIILVEKTLQEEGYDPSSLSVQSRKYIHAVCRFCGKSHRIKLFNFHKSGSACHKECRLKEQSTSSPFKDKSVQEKAKLTNLERYGTPYASQNKDIAKKISETKLTEESKNKTISTNLEKYGVENTFQSDEVKEKIKETIKEKYGVEHPLQSEEIKDKFKKTCIEKYGHDNPFKNEDVQNKRIATNIEKYGYASPQQNQEVKKNTVLSFNESIKNNDYYKLINTLRGNEFWEMLSSEKYSLNDTCEHFGLNYQSVTSRLLHDEFKDKYYTLYNFPRSHKQKELYEIIYKVCSDVRMNDRSIISPNELDIYVPSLGLAFEFNGSFWHSEAFLEPSDAKYKHSKKTIECEKKGIRLIHIFENLWDTRRDQIINLVKSVLNINEKIDARKCVITNTECREFIQFNHIQGYGKRTRMFFNLEYKNEIVGSMTASTHHRIKDDSMIILNRLCFKDGVTVRGGSSKLFSSFVNWAKKTGYKKIVSWSDNCITQGNIYKILGFSLVKEYKPDYFYWDVKNNRYISKQSQKKKTTHCPVGMTEREWCSSRKLYRIWDCGKKLWEYYL